MARGDKEAADRFYVAAEEASRKSLELDPEMRWAELNMATSKMNRFRLEPTHDTSLLQQAAETYARVLARWSVPPETGEQQELFLKSLGNHCDALILLKRFEEAIPTCTRFTELFPELAVGFYNLAGAYALLGRDEEALQALERDFELGDDDWGYLSEDAWFERLRERPEFRSILTRMQARAAAREP